MRSESLSPGGDTLSIWKTLAVNLPPASVPTTSPSASTMGQRPHSSHSKSVTNFTTHSPTTKPSFSSSTCQTVSLIELLQGANSNAKFKPLTPPIQGLKATRKWGWNVRVLPPLCDTFQSLDRVGAALHVCLEVNQCEADSLTPESLVPKVYLRYHWHQARCPSSVPTPLSPPIDPENTRSRRPLRPDYI